jgi:hypothetical protein
MADINTNYYNTTQYKNAQALQNATIDDVAKKYGFDFSRDYAKTQTEAMAQAQRNAQENAKRQNDSANKLNSQRITDDYRGAASSLDKGYFQQFLGQGQSQVNRGLTGGMVADQNLRLAMNKQGELADVWRTRNQASQEESMRYTNQSQAIADALALIEQERIAAEEKMFQDGRLKGYDILSNDRSYGLQLDNTAWGRYQDIFNMDMQKQQAALRARPSGPGGGQPGVGLPKQPANPYGNALPSNKTALQKYLSTPAILAVDKLKSTKPANNIVNKLFSSPVLPAKNPNVSAWSNMYMFGR